MAIASLDDVWVTANFKETQLARIHAGQRATIEVDAYSRKYTGHVESIAGASGARFSLLPPENATGNYVKVVQRVPVKIVLDAGQNQDHSLRLGMSVTRRCGCDERSRIHCGAARGPRVYAARRQSVDHRPVVTLATFMEVLDTSIANVSLPHIAGGLAASQDESTWILTSYLVSNAIVLPMSGWFSSLIGRKRFYMSCVALFTISSFFCGLAPNLGMLIFFRVLQGLAAAGCSPASNRFWRIPSRPPNAAWLSPSTAWPWWWRPAIGPTLGGFITDNYSWRWIFYINVPVGLISLLLDAPADQRSAAFDRGRREGIKIGLHRAGLAGPRPGHAAGGAGQGPARRLVRVAFHSGCSSLVSPALADCGRDLGMAASTNPIIDLKLFRDRSFAIGNVDDVHAGVHSVGHNTAVAAVCANHAGVHGPRGGTGL